MGADGVGHAGPAAHQEDPVPGGVERPGEWLGRFEHRLETGWDLGAHASGDAGSLGSLGTCAATFRSTALAKPVGRRPTSARTWSTVADTAAYAGTESI